MPTTLGTFQKRTPKAKEETIQWTLKEILDLDLAFGFECCSHSQFRGR